MNHSDLVQENERRLSNTTIYEALSIDATDDNQKELCNPGKKCPLDLQEQKQDNVSQTFEVTWTKNLK